MSQHEKKRVVITGIGMVTPLGHEVKTTWDALLTGHNGVSEITHFDATGFCVRIGAEVKNFCLPTKLQNKKLLRYTPPFMHFALSAAEQALTSANLKPDDSTAQRWGLMVGSGMMTTEFDYWKQFSQSFAPSEQVETDRLIGAAGKKFFSSVDYGKTLPNICVNLLSNYYNIRGYTSTLHTACSSSGQALGLALQAIRRGDIDYAVAGGIDSMINPIGVSGFCLLGALSTYNETPQTASRPFDLTRNGFVLGEGAAFVVLESLASARARGVKIYAELAGEGNTLSAYRITDAHPLGEGSIQAIRAALLDADENIDRVDYINAHGTSTRIGDLAETNAIKKVFGQRANAIAVSSTKSQTGHLIAASGALEAAFTALAIDQRCLPMTANLHHPDPDCDLDYVTSGPREQPIRVALSNSFGFGGSNSCLVLRQVD